MSTNTIKNYWFALKPYTFVSFQDGHTKALLYNTRTGDHLEIYDKKSVALLAAIHEKANLGVTLLTGEDLQDECCARFIEQVCSYDMGDITDVDLVERKPVRLMPVLNLQRDVDKLKRESGRSLGEDVMSYLTGLTLHVNTVCRQACPGCSSYYKQVSCCTKGNNSIELSVDAIRHLMAQIQHAPVSALHITGGNILDYTQLDELIPLLSNSSVKPHYRLHYANMAQAAESYDFSRLAYKEVIVNFPLHVPLFKQALQKADANTTWYFIIENEQQFEQAEELTAQIGDMKYQILPFFNGTNLAFFRENIFLSKEDIFSESLGQRKIFRNQALNANYFGSLLIFSDGSVQVNPHTKVLGNMYAEEIIDLIAKEMEENTAWRKVRNSKPCNTCFFQYLCPPPSNYEVAIGKPNLCQVVNE